MEMARAEALHEKKTISDAELEEKKLQWQMHIRQVELLQIMLKGLLSEADYDRNAVWKQIAEMSDNKEDRPRRMDLDRRLIQVETRIKILKQIAAD